MHWILVANAAHARLFEVNPSRDESRPARGPRLTLLESFEHPQGRLPEAGLRRDRAGWSLGPSHQGGAPLAPRSDARRLARHHFAQVLATYLETAAQQSRFTELTLAAEPAFLGDLRLQLGSATRRLVRNEHAADLSHVGLAELGARLHGITA